MYIFVSFLEESFKERRSADFWKIIFPRKETENSKKTKQSVEERC